MAFDHFPKPLELVNAGQASELELVQSMLPQLDDQRKVGYLVLRSVSFLRHEALQALDLTHDTYQYWVDTDEVFKEFETKQLRYIQGHVAREVLRAGFMRNVFLQLSIDTEVLRKRAFSAETMTPSERDDAREAGKRYNAQSLSAMAKIIGEPTGRDETKSGEEAAGAAYEFYVPVTDDDTDAILNKRAQAKALLTQFSKNPSKYNDDDGNSE